MLLLVKWQHTANRRACFVMSRFVYLSFFFSPSDISRSQAQQGPEALPQPEVSEVFPRPRAAEDHPSQSVSPCCALWVQKYKRWQDCECGCWNQDIWLTNAVFKHHFFSFTLMTHFLLASFSLVSSPAHLISLPLDSPVNDHTLIPLKKKKSHQLFPLTNEKVNERMYVSPVLLSCISVLPLERQPQSGAPFLQLPHIAVKYTKSVAGAKHPAPRQTPQLGSVTSRTVACAVGWYSPALISSFSYCTVISDLCCHDHNI